MLPWEMLGSHGGCSRKMISFSGEMVAFPTEVLAFSRKVPKWSSEMLLCFGEVLGYSQ